MEEAVRTSLLCVVFSVQARGRGGGKGKKLVLPLSANSFSQVWWISGVAVGLDQGVSQTQRCSREKPRALSGCG